MPSGRDHLRILWLSNAPWTQTGYGNQTGVFVKRLQKAGHKVAGMYYFGYQGPNVVQGKDTMYGIGKSQWGDDVLATNMLHYDADLVISLMDVWVLPEQIGAVDGIKYCPWLPVDHAPAPEAVVARLKGAYRPIAMSQFGQQMLHDAGVPADYIPHGVETKKLRPISTAKRKEAKRWLGFEEDHFLVGMVSANKGWPTRKGFPEAFEGFSDFLKEVPEARMYVHTFPDDRFGGPDLRALALDYGIPGDHVRFPYPEKLHIGFDDDAMRRIYNAFDVLLCPSYGEGFGIPIVEAQACGTPVIVTDFSSMPELCHSGWLVKPARRWWTPLRSFQVLPDIPDITAKLLEAHETLKDPSQRTYMAAKAHQLGLHYDADRVFEQFWAPWLETVLEENKVFHVENPHRGARDELGTADGTAQLVQGGAARG